METAPRGTPLSLSKLLHKDKDHVSTNSLANSSDSGVHAPPDSGFAQQDAPESTGLRASMDSAMDKVKDRVKDRVRRRSVASVDDRGLERRGSDDSRRLSTLVSKTKRKVKKGLKESLKVGDADSQRSLSMDSRLGSELEGNHSDSSLLYGSGRSSLLTDDDRSDLDG